MTVKIIGSSLMLSFFFLCIVSYKNITDEEFKNFKGVDVTATCECATSMQKMCLQIFKSQGMDNSKTAFKEGFPKCEDKDVQLQKAGCQHQELVIVKVKLLVCRWEGNSHETYFSKGQGPNHVLNYNCDPSSCVPFSDIKIQQ